MSVLFNVKNYLHIIIGVKYILIYSRHIMKYKDKFLAHVGAKNIYLSVSL